MVHILEADGINLNLDSRNILSDIYLKCETGKITGLVGRNGQGKSCLMNVIWGNLNGGNASIRIDNNHIRHGDNRPDLLLYLPQFNFISGSLKIKQILDDFRLPASDLEIWFPEFKRTGDLKVERLSGGHRRLLEIFVIVKTPSLFSMLDEPFTHLHPIQVAKLKEFLTIEKFAKGILITDHMYKHVLDISDSVYLLKEGATYLIKDEHDLGKLGYVNF